MSRPTPTQVTMQSVESLMTRNEEVQKRYCAPPEYLTLVNTPDRPPAICIITCADSRVIPEKYFNFDIGEYFVIRNAGGRTQDTLRSLMVLDQAIGLGAVLVVHHTDCGLSHNSNHTVREGVKKIATPELAETIDAMDYGEIVGADFQKSLAHDTKLIRDSGFFKNEMKVLGYLFDLRNGSVSFSCGA